jgi:hypothetical protein
MPCPYSELLGKRGEGVHARRIYGFALNDILMTIAGAILTSIIFNVHIGYSLAGWFIIGEVLHVMFGVDTRFLELIGLNKDRLCSV